MGKREREREGIMDPPLSVDRARCSLSLSLSPKDIPVRGIFFATSRDKPLTIIYYSRNSFRTDPARFVLESEKEARESIVAS